jgi:hypothetical protein
MSETSVHRRRSFLTTLMLAGFAAAACLLVAGCSPGVDYPSIFPAVHDMPAPRADTPMDADQVQQATEDLITERNHLEAQQQGSGQAKTTAPPATGGTSQPTAKYQPAAAVSTKNAATSANAQGAAAADGTLAAGAETK